MSPIVIALSIVGVLELISLYFIIRWTFTEPTIQPNTITSKHLLAGGIHSRTMFNAHVAGGGDPHDFDGCVIYDRISCAAVDDAIVNEQVAITQVPATLENLEKFFNEPSTSSYLGEIKR